MKSADPSHGGARRGAGRPRGSGRCDAGEAQTQLRIPRADKQAVLDLLATRRALRHIQSWRPAPQTEIVPLPLYGSRVPAGFPSPADDYLESTLDLNQYLIQDAPATFMVRVKGDSMIGAGIAEGDILVVEKGRHAQHDQIVLAVIDGEFTVKRLHRRDEQVALLPENPAYAPITLRDGQDLTIWGVVTACVKKF
ncbi:MULTISPECIES: LexA family transcriptional regulator [unclassified Paludibacterium]|uniref:LexA family protein n=1 Tax=unclassified Paludibacterium TaxID=2618429 RepID=UPI001C0520AB|nr:translesion error-prone DNA polymerase V autoproteolytic subunit [Paludibacterium sp. B53371]BEV70932.1 translesion error-prone DNA polymerase V autoproteolytic subunit [Paludibacterium sp. THUN1379]